MVGVPEQLLATSSQSRLEQLLRGQGKGRPGHKDDIQIPECTTDPILQQIQRSYPSVFLIIHFQRNVTSSELQENERRSPGVASEGPVMYTSVGATVEEDIRHFQFNVQPEKLKSLQ